MLTLSLHSLWSLSSKSFISFICFVKILGKTIKPNITYSHAYYSLREQKTVEIVGYNVNGTDIELLTATGELLTVATEVMNTVGDITKVELPTLVTASAKDGTVAEIIIQSDDNE